MDFNRIKDGFKLYLAELNEKKGKSINEDLKLNNTASIFLHSNEFRNYLSSEYQIDTSIMSKSINDILNMDVVNGKLVDVEEMEDAVDFENGEFFDVAGDEVEAASENVFPDANISEGTEVAEESEGAVPPADVPEKVENAGNISMTDIINEFFEDADIKSAIDADGNGELSTDEIQNFLGAASSLDGDEKNLSIEDLFSAADIIKENERISFTEDINKETAAIEDKTDASVKTEEKANEPVPSSSGSSGVSGSSGGGYVGGSSGGGYVGGSSGTASDGATSNVAKTVDNMNADELKAELDTKKGELSTKQTELDKAASGETPELQAKQEAIDEAYDKYLEEVKNVDEKLAKELNEKKTDIDNKKQEIADKESEISENECKVSEAETAVSNAEAKIGSLESAISSISSSISSSDFSDEKKASLQSKKSELESQLKEAKQEKTDAEKSLEKAKDALKTSKEEKADLEKDLETFEGEMEEIEAKILEANPEIEEYMNEYKEAQEDFDTAKADAISKAQDAVKVAQDEVNKIQNKLTEVQNKAIEASAKLSSLAGSYNYNGNEYNCIMDQAELDKLVADAARGGAGTKFGKNDKCLSIAETYGAWMTGDSNTSCAMSGEYQDATKYSVFNTENKEELLATIKEELDAGRPPVLHVNGSGIGRHYVTVVGYKESAGDTLQESDLLIWDSYACTIGSCPDDRHMITGWSTGRTGSDGYGWQVYKRK